MAWTWAAARCRGTSHLADGSRCQDALSGFELSGGTLVAILCDGAGSAPKGGEGASLVSRVLGLCIREHFKGHTTDPDDETIFGWIDEIRDKLAYAAEARNLRLRDFASTLIYNAKRLHSALCARLQKSRCIHC